MKKDPQTYTVIGMVMEVHRERGGGFLEAVYQDGLAVELGSLKIAESAGQNFLVSEPPGSRMGAQSMIANRNFGQVAPLTWMGRLPVYLATVLAGVLAVSMVATAFALALGGNDAIQPLVFQNATALGRWQVWQFATYPLVNPPNLFFALQVLMFAWFGAEVEKFLGRRSFAILCGLLLLAMPGLLAVLGVFGVGLPLAGSEALTFSIFLAFVLIYPRAQIFFSIEARWIALILMAIFTLQALAEHAWAQLIMLWWGLAVTVLWLKIEGVASLHTARFSDFARRKHSERNLKVARREDSKAGEVGVHDSIDPILEKIARQGIASLSRGEREKLERARTALIEKERHP